MENYQEIKCTTRQAQEVLEEDKQLDYRKRRQKWFSGLAFSILSKKWVCEEIPLPYETNM